MSGLRRYTLVLKIKDGGEYVLLSDVERLLAEKDAEIERWKKLVRIGIQERGRADFENDECQAHLHNDIYDLTADNQRLREALE